MPYIKAKRLWKMPKGLTISPASAIKLSWPSPMVRSQDTDMTISFHPRECQSVRVSASRLRWSSSDRLGLLRRQKRKCPREGNRLIFAHKFATNIEEFPVTHPHPANAHQNFGGRLKTPKTKLIIKPQILDRIS